MLGKENKFEFSTEDNLNSKDIQICTDKWRLKQVLINLVSNSLKFTHKGFVEISFGFL